MFVAFTIWLCLMALAGASFVLAMVITFGLIAVEHTSREVARGRLALVPQRAAASALLAVLTVAALLVGYDWFGASWPPHLW